MRAFILALALPLALTACQSETADDIEATGDAIEEQYDEAADDLEATGDAIEAEYDEAADAADEAIEDGAPAGDMEDVIGDGEVIDEAGEPEGDEM